jgi:small GTP-binding protein
MVTLQIWDTAGQERFQSLGSAFYRGADACMLVFDITSSESFNHIATWQQEFTLQAGKKEMILIGNKADMQEKRQVFIRGVQQWCAQNAVAPDVPMPYVETSAKANTAVADAFRKVAAEALKLKVQPVDDVMAGVSSVKLKQAAEPPKKENKSCC